MRKRICSDKHFKSLLKSFKSMAEKQILANKHLKHKGDSYLNFRLYSGTLSSILRKFAANPYKTCIGFKKHVPDTLNNIWYTYTLERDKRRLKGLNDVKNGDKIVFRYYVKDGQYRKKLYARWSVEVTWIK